MKYTLKKKNYFLLMAYFLEITFIENNFVFFINKLYHYIIKKALFSYL